MAEPIKAPEKKYEARKHFSLGGSHFNPGDVLSAKNVQQLEKAESNGLAHALKEGFIREKAHAKPVEAPKGEQKPQGEGGEKK
jgi:hypothetical protein